jgi:undecaprenyl-diphosphatase
MGSLGARLGELDLAGLRLARTHGHTPALDRAVRAYSGFGENAVGWVALGLAGGVLDGGRRERWWRATRVVARAYVVNQAIKLAVRRPRPLLPDLPPLMDTPTQLSFPSAHATSSFAAARAFAPLVPALPLRLAAGAMAASRLYLGVHYPSDIVAGMVLGSALGGNGAAR